MWFYIFQGVGYGFAAASQPGPFQTYLISQTITRGWKRTLPAALAPLISDGPIIVLCLFVLSQVPVWMERALHIASGSFILYLAYGAYKSWGNFDSNARIVALSSANNEENVGLKSISKAVLMNILNPNPYIYWTLVTGPILIEGWRKTPANGIGFLAGFYLTLISAMAAIILIFGMASKLGPQVSRSMIGISSIALFIFGFFQLWKGFA